MSNIIDSILLSGTVYTLQESGGGTVSSAITSGDTNAVAGGAVYDKFDEVEQVTARALNDLDEKKSSTVELTQEEYDALTTKDPNTYYVITDATPIDVSTFVTSGQMTSAITQATSGKVNTSSVVSSVTSGSTDSEIPTAKAVYDAIPTGSTLPFTITGIDNTSIIRTNQGGNVSQKSSFAYGSNLTIGPYDYANSAAFGTDNSTNGQASFICGMYNTIDRLVAGGFVCGQHNTLGYYCTAGHIEGGYNNIGRQARYAHSEGCYTTANGYYSHTEGYYTNTNNTSEHASGQYNVSSSASTTFGDSGNTLFSVGNGTTSSARHNAFEIRQNGDIYFTLNGQDVKLQDNLGGTASSAITSGDTNAVQGGAVYNKFDEVEQVTARALNELAEGQEVTARALNDLNEKINALIEANEVVARALNDLNDRITALENA